LDLPTQKKLVNMWRWVLTPRNEQSKNRPMHHPSGSQEVSPSVSHALNGQPSPVERFDNLAASTTLSADQERMALQLMQAVAANAAFTADLVGNFLLRSGVAEELKRLGLPCSFSRHFFFGIGSDFAPGALGTIGTARSTQSPTTAIADRLGKALLHA